MSISKKIRFEVFKRDGFQCAYCGKTPPAVILEIDHIDPKSKGGKDSINNLLTACFDCNRGKRDIPLDKAPPKISENLEILKAKEEQLKEYRKYINKIEKRIEGDMESINQIYIDNVDGKYQLSEHFKQTSLRKFLEYLPVHEVRRAMIIATTKFPGYRDKVIKYFCGVCWKTIKGPQDAKN